MRVSRVAYTHPQQTPGSHLFPFLVSWLLKGHSLGWAGVGIVRKRRGNAKGEITSSVWLWSANYLLAGFLRLWYHGLVS